MKPRARRVTMGVAALVAVLLAILALANWSTVREHVEAWHFQLTRRTALMSAEGWCCSQSRAERLSFELSALTGRAVIFDPAENDYEPMPLNMSLRGEDGEVRVFVPLGYRILDQRFPRRAYVVIGTDGPKSRAVPPRTVSTRA